MADTFASLNVHCVFSIKNREPLLVGEIKERLWAFMGGSAKRNEIKPLQSIFNGTWALPLRRNTAHCAKSMTLRQCFRESPESNVGGARKAASFSSNYPKGHV
jgi:hypothetical protein